MPLMNLQSFLIYSLSKEFLRTDHEAGIRLVQGINSKQDQHSPHSQRTYGQKRVLGEKFKGESTFEVTDFGGCLQQVSSLGKSDG